MSEIRVSAIVCTRNRAASLARTLSVLAAVRLDGIAFELVVVDNASSDKTPAIIAAFAAPFPVRAVTELRPGLSAARNRGIAAASGDIILFTDDDCYVSPDWVQAAVRFLRENPCQLIGGRVDLFDPANLKLSFKSDPAPDRLTSTAGLFYFMLGANLAFGRAVVDRIGGFDVRLGPGSALHAADDTDFVYRAYAAGIPVRYEPSMVVSHDHGRSGDAVRARLLRGYAEGTGALVMKSLLAGRTDLLRPLYWDVRAELRAWRENPSDWRSPLSRAGFVTGALRFLWASRKPSA